MTTRRYRVSHVTSYTYSHGATLASNLAHLVPRSTPTQRVLASDVVIDPVPDDRVDRVDHLGNRATWFTVERPHEYLRVAATSTVELDEGVVPGSAHQPWESARDVAVDPVTEHLYRIPSRLVPELAHVAKLAEDCFVPGGSLADGVAGLSHRIFTEWAYDPTATTVATPLADVVAARRGVCQDFAHLAVGALRALRLPARYVSGYLETFPPAGQPKLVGADASHAWAAVRCPDGSWLDLDPTNDVLAPSTHVTVAWGRDYSDVVPVKGVLLSPGGTTSLNVEVDVARVDVPAP